MKVVFSNRAYASILAETTEKIKTETGGLFLGTVEEDVWYVIEAIDPGPKSIFEVAYFEYDQKYTEHLINKIANLYNQKLALIGLWHRHPGSMDYFSSTDDGTNAKYAALNQQGAISALVNVDPKFRLTVYQVDRPCRYTKIEYDVGNHLIPDKYLELKTPDSYFSLMEKMLHGSQPSNRNINGYHVSVSLASFLKLITPHMADLMVSDLDTTQMQFDESAQEKVLDAIMEDLSFMADESKIEVSVSMTDCALVMFQEAINKTTSMYFGFSSQKESVVVSYEGKCFLYRSGLFKEMYEVAKKHLDRMREEGHTVRPIRKHDGILDQVIKVIRFKKNEE